MEIKMIGENMAEIDSAVCVIFNLQSALDIMGEGFGAGWRKLAINKEALAEEFFDLKSGLAGDILQKFVNYGFRVAIYGDFSVYSSKSLKDFIYESNKGKSVFFAAHRDQAIGFLNGA